MTVPDEKSPAEKKVTELYKKHLKEILSFVYSFVHNQDDARELTQDIFYKLFNDFENHNVKIDNPRAYLYRIARNHCIDEFRKRKIKTSELNEAIDSQSHVDSQEDRVVNKIMLDSIIRYIETNLSEAESSIFKLKYYYEMTLEEIAYVVDSSKSSVSREIIKITGKLEKEFPDVI